MSGLSPLTEQQVEFYNLNGYLNLEKLLPEDECERVQTICEEVADEKYSAILNLDRTEIEIRELLKRRDFVSRLEQLQETEIVGLMTQILFKKPGTPYATQAWNPHQDNAYPRAEYGAYITLNVFLEDADPENGGMFIYPSSHKEGLLPFLERKSYREDIGESPGHVVTPPDQYERVNLYFNKGDALVLHGCVIHGSLPNKSVDRSRLLCQLVYIKQGIDFISGKNANRKVIPLY